MKKILIVAALLATGLIGRTVADPGSGGWTCYNWTLGPGMDYISCSHKNGNSFTVRIQ